MRSDLKLFALAGIGAAALAGCTSIVTGPTGTKSYSLSNFDGVSASAGVDVVLRQGPFDVSAKGPEKGFDTLRIEVQGSTLQVGREQHMFGWSNRGHYTVTVSAPTYVALHASSGSDVKGEGLTFADLKVGASSGADMQVSGSCKSLELNVSSGSDFKGDELKCESVEANGSSGAGATVFASVSAKGHASSGSDIKVLGHPPTFDHDTSSGGSVRAP